MRRFTGVEFGFENEHKAERHPPPAEGLKAASTSAPRRLQSKSYATSAKGEILTTAVIAALVLIVAKWFGA